MDSTMDSTMDKLHTGLLDRRPDRVCQSPVSTQLRYYDPVFPGQESDRDSCTDRVSDHRQLAAVPHC